MPWGVLCCTSIFAVGLLWVWIIKVSIRSTHPMATQLYNLCTHTYLTPQHHASLNWYTPYLSTLNSEWVRHNSNTIQQLHVDIIITPTQYETMNMNLVGCFVQVSSGCTPGFRRATETVFTCCSLVSCTSYASTCMQCAECIDVSTGEGRRKDSHEGDILYACSGCFYAAWW